MVHHQKYMELRKRKIDIHRDIALRMGIKFYCRNRIHSAEKNVK